MSLNYYFEEIDEFTFSEKTNEWIEKIIQSEKKEAGDISFVFCSDHYLLGINKEFLNHDYFTDVITFDYVEGDKISGDIFISIDRVKENAETFNVTYKNELNRVMIHGILHLLGYKDKSVQEKQLMTQKEDEYLSKLRLS